VIGLQSALLYLSLKVTVPVAPEVTVADNVIALPSAGLWLETDTEMVDTLKALAGMAERLPTRNALEMANTMVFKNLNFI
jgi:acyl carrier protein phosphodiesterase